MRGERSNAQGRCHGEAAPVHTRRPPARAVDAPPLPPPERLPVPPLAWRCCCLFLPWASRWCSLLSFRLRRASAAPSSSPICSQQGSRTVRWSNQWWDQWAGSDMPRRQSPPRPQYVEGGCVEKHRGCTVGRQAVHQAPAAEQGGFQSRIPVQNTPALSTAAWYCSMAAHPPWPSGLPAGGRRAPGWGGWRCAAAPS